MTYHLFIKSVLLFFFSVNLSYSFLQSTMKSAGEFCSSLCFGKLDFIITSQEADVL